MSFYENIRDLQIELNRDQTPWGKLEKHDAVVLTTDLPDHRLLCGDVGTIMYAHVSGNAFEVDFIDGEGFCLASLRMDKTQIRRWQRDELLSVRPIG